MRGWSRGAACAGLLATLCVTPLACAAPAGDPCAGRDATIRRDEWGIPHVHGRTDADAVFGLVYAQAEDAFPRIEMNYLNALGRTAEAEGVGRLYHDLRMRLVVDEDELRRMHDASPPWLRDLTGAWADALNCYLAVNPAVRPRVLDRYEPWMTLAFSEGSIGWDIERVSIEGLETFYAGAPAHAQAPRVAAEFAADLDAASARGSNGIALAGRLTQSGRAMLLINPHTSFYFRGEAHVRSDAGLNAYGAVTWGQFFVYQGFNERLGWMHTSTGADFLDEYALTVRRDGEASPAYRYGDEWRPLRRRTVTLRYRTAAGMAERTFEVLASHHGPVVREEGGRWIAVRLMHEPVNALTQSYLRTKTRDFAAFRTVLNLHTNSSNNTVYADADGNVAYFHANFVPRRDPGFDWSRPVDGSDPATEWRGLHGVDESPIVVNPATGWLQNTNNSPWSVAGSDSPRAADYPAYMDQAGENARGVHAVQLLGGRRAHTLHSLVALAYDPHLPAFDVLLPPLLEAYSRLPDADARREALAAPVAALQRWNRHWATGSAATTLAIHWAEALWERTGANPRDRRWDLVERVAHSSTDDDRLGALEDAVAQLVRDHGDWSVPWGEVNRWQRTPGGIVATFDDSAPSIPVPFTSGRWGSLATFEARTYPGTVRRYGTSGNSFVAVVELGPRVRAQAVLVGGQGGAPGSPHFADQARRYADGALRPVHFHDDEVARATVRTYRPGRAPGP